MKTVIIQLIVLLPVASALAAPSVEREAVKRVRSVSPEAATEVQGVCRLTYKKLPTNTARLAEALRKAWPAERERLDSKMAASILRRGFAHLGTFEALIPLQGGAVPAAKWSVRLIFKRERPAALEFSSPERASWKIALKRVWRSGSSRANDEKEKEGLLLLRVTSTAKENAGGLTIELSLGGERFATRKAIGHGAPIKTTPTSGKTYLADVKPILQAKGCALCHQPAMNRSRFELSAGLSDDRADWTALRALIDPKDPAASRLLLKPALVLQHGGGLRIPTDSPEYKTLLDWIRGGSPLDTDATRKSN